MNATAVRSPGFEISLSALEKILVRATRAPTGDNCQPWSFEWNGTTLNISHLESRGRHRINCANHASLLALGCLLEALDIAASTEGLSVSSHLDLRNTKSWASVSFHPGRNTEDPLSEFLEKRTTDRGIYYGQPLAKSLRDEITQDSAAFFSNCKTSFLTTYSDEFVQYVKRCEDIVWKEKAYHTDLFRWIRFSKQENESSRDGMFWPNLGVSWPEAKMLSLCRNFSFQQLMNRLGFLQNSRRLLGRQIKSSAALYCIAVKSLEKSQLVEAGRLALRIWLTLTGNGFAVQPLTLASLSTYDELTGTLPGDVLPEYRERYRAGLEILRRHFDFSGEQYPVWMFRTGLSKTKHVPTLRLSLASVLKVI